MLRAGPKRFCAISRGVGAGCTNAGSIVPGAEEYPRTKSDNVLSEARATHCFSSLIVSAAGTVSQASEIRRPRGRLSRAATGRVHAVTENGGGEVKNCKLCKYSKLCNDLPGVCVLIPYVAVAVVAVAMGYLFITQELL